MKETKVSATDYVTLLGVEIDNKLKFDKYFKALCSKVNMKINACARLCTFFLQRTGTINLQCGENYECPFEIVLNCSGSVCIHAKNLQNLMIEIYMSINHVRSSFVWVFHGKKCVEYKLRTKSLCKLPTIRSTSFGLESLYFRGSFL